MPEDGKKIPRETEEKRNKRVLEEAEVDAASTSEPERVATELVDSIMAGDSDKPFGDVTPPEEAAKAIKEVEELEGLDKNEIRERVLAEIELINNHSTPPELDSGPSARTVEIKKEVARRRWVELVGQVKEITHQALTLDNEGTLIPVQGEDLGNLTVAKEIFERAPVIIKILDEAKVILDFYPNLFDDEEPLKNE